ncbi:hypothetical protein [Acinetobacter sp.]|uniref:hypothetical protein n=1 Tax=Acinetobacter sp. TaxID=472 RepID=UPI0035ADF9B2
MSKNLAAEAQNPLPSPICSDRAESSQLHQQSHVFIVSLGAILGVLISLSIGYHLRTTAINMMLLSLIPLALSYVLREVYIYTLTHMQD